MSAVVFIGAGPGAADLITVRGAQHLAAAQVVLFDALTDPALRELAPNARWIDVGKRGFCDSTGQVAINALLVRHARNGQRVVRLKGGDPSVFGRLEEELEALNAAGIEAEVVPGVTAAIAAAAAAQRPLTRRGSGRSVSLTTAMTRSGELQATRTADTEVFYMAGRQLAALGRHARARRLACRLARPDAQRPQRLDAGRSGGLARGAPDGGDGRRWRHAVDGRRITRQPRIKRRRARAEVAPPRASAAALKSTLVATMAPA